MRDPSDSAGDGLPARLLALSAGALLASSGLAARLAIQHMQALGEICGGSASAVHCGWCATAAALALSGLGLLAAARRLRPLKARS